MSQSEAEYLSRLRSAVVAMREMQHELDAVQYARTEPIAIIGMGCRFPGGASTPESFWKLLDKGVDTITEVPADRWGDDPFHYLDPSHPEQRATRWGAFLKERMDLFDPQFFGISPREAVNLDPQQRMVLEVTWEALERAGLSPELLSGTRTGVFLGINTNDYEQYGLFTDPKKLDIYTASGNGHCFPPGRLSYSLGLQGPSMAVDTACSSSLVAVHLACQSLRNGESSVAIAGGVNAMVLPWLTYIFARSQALSPDGRCKTFDAQANGYVRGEGCGMIILKRLSDARAAGDRVLAVIRGSAVNQDGRSTGLTAPNALAQQAMLRQALESANLSAADISYVETHGTGTALGDPIEVQAISDVLGPPREDGSPCVLGALKSNVGHLEAAAGIAGLIKVVLSMQHEAIPTNLHFKRLNPRIQLEGTSLKLATRKLEWKKGGKRRYAGVNSFGISGTNAHVILEEAPNAEPLAPEQSPIERVLTLSARSAPSLDGLAREYVKYLGADGEGQPWSERDIAFSAALRRSHYKQRLSIVGRTREEWRQSLEAYLAGERPSSIARSEVVSDKHKVVFVFPGQGSQWEGMGRKLLQQEPVFRSAIEECDAAIRQEMGWSLLEELQASGEQSKLNRIDIIQPALFAMSVGLATLWKHWGVQPDAVVGHSMGEIAAAYVAGALSLQDAVKIICRRSHLMRRLSGKGAMALVELSLDQARQELQGFEQKLSVAVSNGPRATVISGEPQALEKVLEKLEKRGVFCRRIKVDVASHSPQMDELRSELLQALSSVKGSAPRVTMQSTVIGRAVKEGELNANYWVSNLREPVLFAQGVDQLLKSGHEVFLEMSPHPILLPSVEEALKEAGDKGLAVASLRRDQDDRHVLLESVAALHSHGVSVNLKQVNGEQGQVVPLPTYQWQRERYWVDAGMQVAPLARGQSLKPGEVLHPLMGRSFSLSIMPGTRCWEQTLSVEAVPYLSDHRVQGEVVVPGAAYVEMGLSAAAAVFGQKPYALEGASFERMLALPAKKARTVQVTLTEQQGGEATFQVSSQAEAGTGWVRHATGKLRQLGGAKEAARGEEPRKIRERCTVSMQGSAYYPLVEKQHIQYGPGFQGVQELWQGTNEVLGRVRLPDAAATQLAAYQLHPALLDASFQVLGALLFAPGGKLSEGGEPYVPVGVESVRVHRRPEREVWAHGRLRPVEKEAKEYHWDIALLDETGGVFAEVKGLRVQKLEGGVGARPVGEEWLYALEWKKHEGALPEHGPEGGEGAWLVLLDGAKTGNALAAQLEARGQRCVKVVAAERYEKLEPGLFRVDASSPEDYRRVLEEAFGETGCRGVVHLWSLDASAQDVERARRTSTLSALYLAQAVVKKGWRETPRLWLVTRGAHAVNAGEDVSVAQAPLWGFGRALALEHPELRTTLVDVVGEEAQTRARALFAELGAADGETQVAWREKARYVARLVRGTYESLGGEPVQFKSDATYLLTGGLGGLGLTVAKWMVEKGARNLVLMGRREPTEAARQVLQGLEKAGALVVVERADVSQREQVEAVLKRMEKVLPPLKGVLHAAVVLEDRTVLEMDGERFDKPMGAKVRGAWNLHTLTADKALDFFVMYSSGASLLGSPGQTNYAAANAFLDALAQHRRSQGLTGLSINWGAFSDVGQAAAQSNRGERLLHRGVGSIKPAQGTAVLERLLSGRAAQVAVMSFDARQWLESYPGASSPLWAELLAESGAAGAEEAGAVNIREELRKAEPGQRGALLEEHLKKQLARALRLEPSRLDRHEPFINMGMDSLVSLELRNRLEASLGLKLSATLLFTYPELASLSEYLLGQPALTGEAEGGAEAQPRGGDAVENQRSWFALTKKWPKETLRLFCIPGAGASASFFRAWGPHVPEGLGLYPVEMPAHGMRIAEPHLERMEVLIPAMARALEPYLGERFALFGHSMGSLYAFELTRHLRKKGLVPEHLFVSSFKPPHLPMPASIALRLSDKEFLEMSRQRGFITEEFGREHDAELMKTYLPTLRKDFALMESYSYVEEEPLDIPLTVFGSRQDRLIASTQLDTWGEHTRGRLSTYLFDGDHFFAREAGETLLAHITEKLKLG
ncbi:type I polyketide synthase [Vitiosangium sp. GDMCC 1.1324]|uniref:type I polyketide synthase n=1 Tax=Vitiosangium sp. (strain GDMCC 1.1324) TaxID=2138576 RepID=UPI000D3A333B|nr:type I polyketide synthase [Vitiosangium sp. GDMCC 1.1324]PTL76611.1 polyketide synthase [Vitiosangium sp. GDMCC 1.1324]